MGSRTLLARLAAPLALVVAVFVLYARTAGHEFVEYDTTIYLTANPRVLSGLSLDNVRWAFSNFQAANWHPLTWLSHMLDVELFGLSPAGHNLENAGWHAANTLLVLALFRSLGLGRGAAFAGALLFALHPLRVESVAWIVERKDLLFCFFGLSSLLAWLSWSREGTPWKLAAALLLYACSLMCKAMLVTLPCLLVLLEFWPLGRTSARPRRRDLATLAFLALSLCFCILTVLAQGSAGAVQGLSNFPLALRLETALDSYVWYVGRTLWPAQLAFHYPLALHEPRIGAMLLDAALLATLTLLAWLARRRWPALLVGWLWFLGTLVPVSGVLQVGGQAHADRYTYFPSLGLLLGACFVGERELLPRMGGRALALACGALALALAVVSWVQIGTWRSTETLTRHALAVTHENNVAFDVLGAYYAEHGRPEEALPLLREAVRIAPTDPDAVSNLGGTLLRAGQLDESEKLLLRASRLVPGRAQTWSLLGGLYFTRGRYAEAMTVLDRAVALDPWHIGAWCNRALTLDTLGRYEEALDSLRHAIALRGNSWAPRLTLGRLLLRLGRAEEARPHFELVLREEPRDFEALRGLERVELACGATQKAWDLAVRAESVRPGSAPALADQAWILAVADAGPLAQPERALQLAQQALASGGEQPALLDALALAAAANGDFARAAAAAEQALATVRPADPLWAGRLERRLLAYRAGRIDRETPR
jgi:tetratricopeptide (TPR) repeat protein